MKSATLNLDRLVAGSTENPRPTAIASAARAPCIPVDLHLAPGPADDVLADRPLKQAE